MLCISCHFIPLKPLTLLTDHAKLPDVLTTLPVSHAILPRAVCFATSRPANHAICSFIESSEYESGPIRICLFIDYIIKKGSYMSAHVLLNLLSELKKNDKMRGVSSILSLFCNEFNKFNNTRARMLDYIYHTTIRLISK